MSTKWRKVSAPGRLGNGGKLLASQRAFVPEMSLQESPISRRKMSLFEPVRIDVPELSPAVYNVPEAVGHAFHGDRKTADLRLCDGGPAEKYDLSIACENEFTAELKEGEEASEVPDNTGEVALFCLFSDFSCFAEIKVQIATKSVMAVALVFFSLKIAIKWTSMIGIVFA